MSKFLTKKTVYKLCPNTIDEVSETVEDICTLYKTDRKVMLRNRLSIEESLGIWLDNLGEGTEITVETSKKFFKPYFQISAEGERCNPYNSDEENYGNSENSMLVNIGLVPAFTYSKGKNILTFNIRKKQLNQIVVLLLIVASAVVLGVLFKNILNPDTINILSENIISPIEDTVFKILSCIAGPMIFLSVAWGVYGIGDVYTLGVVGKKLMLSFFGVVFAFSALGSLFYPLLGPAISLTSSQTSQLNKIFSMILDIFPSNVFSPFVEGNTLQIILLGFIIGLALIFLGQRTRAVATAVEQINYIVSFLMNTISKLVPYFVFVVLLRIIWNDSLKVFFGIGRFAVTYLVAYLLLISGFLLYVSAKRKVSPFKLLKVCLPSFLIAVTTASSAATFDSNMKIAQKKLGINKAFSAFGIPFGQVVFKSVSALYYVLLCFFFASKYGINVSVSWIISAVVIAAISAVATPPIPGGAAATYTMIFLQLGIPSNALAIALSIDMIFDFFQTSGDMMMLLLEMLNVSGKIGMLDKNTLHNKLK